MEHVVNLVKATRCQNFTQDKNTFPGELIRKEESRDLSPSRLMKQTSKQILIFSKSQKFFFFSFSQSKIHRGLVSCTVRHTDSKSSQ